MKVETSDGKGDTAAEANLQAGEDMNLKLHKDVLAEEGEERVEVGVEEHWRRGVREQRRS